VDPTIGVVMPDNTLVIVERAKAWLEQSIEQASATSSLIEGREILNVLIDQLEPAVPRYGRIEALEDEVSLHSRLLGNLLAVNVDELGQAGE
jgi:hypothetical protein